ncbi:hypothetical protein GLOIN_2v1673942 [Rhizophagus irregularis DAOM 181602=DAOM 197198]|nr:hypothetical protein GLOIN_2v1673942 [Rhizophagus irregularis DAOM 181602=DAOM 197198]
MSGNYAKRGRGSHNPNSRKASRQERKNNNNSDNSSSDGENTIQQKRNRTITENSMEEDYVADDQTADVGVDGPSSSPQQNISGENTLASSPKRSAVPTAPSHVASSGNVDASMHAPSNKDLQQPPNASPNLNTNGAPDGDQTPDPVVTFAITRDDFQAAAAPNAAPESLKKFPTNKALIEAVNNLFLETYESFTGKACMTGSGEAKRLVIHFHTAEARDLSPGYPSYRYPFLYQKGQPHGLFQKIWQSAFLVLPDNTNKLCHRCGKLGCAPNFCPLKQTRGRSRTCDPVAKLKERFNVNQPRSNSNIANARSRSRSRSKSKDRSASNSGRANNASHDRTNNDNSNHNKPPPNTSQRARHNSKERSVSFSSSSRSTARPLPRQTPNFALSPDDANNILNLLRELQCEVANFHKRISALELADQRMTRIESHLGLDPLPIPNEPEPDLMQEDAPVTHVPLNILSSAKSSLPPKSILTRPSPTFTIVPDTSPPSSHLSPNAPPFTPISSTQEEINDLKNSRVAIKTDSASSN